MMRTLGSLSLVLMTAATAGAQVRVLGPPPEPKVEWLKSPMVLETALPPAEVIEGRGWKASASTRELTAYAVNGVRLDEVAIDLGERREGCDVAVSARAIVEAGHDKEIQLTVEVLRGEESLWSFSIEDWGLDGSETATRRWMAPKPVGADRCRDLSVGATLRVTYWIANDL